MKTIIADMNYIKGILTETTIPISEEAEQIFASIQNDIRENACLRWKSDFEGMSVYQILGKIEGLLCQLRDKKSYQQEKEDDIREILGSDENE